MAPKTDINISYHGLELSKELLNLLWINHMNWKYNFLKVPHYRIFHFTRNINNWLERFYWFINIDLSKNTWFTIIFWGDSPSRIETDSLWPSTASWNKLNRFGFFRKICFTKILFVVSKLEVPCLYTITIPYSQHRMKSH